MVPFVIQATVSRTTTYGVAGRPVDPAVPGGSTSTGPQPTLDGLLLVRESRVKKGLSEASVSMILESWRSSTKKQYLTYIHTWIVFCDRGKVETFTSDVAHILDFLSELYKEGLGYSAINSARSALSSFLGVTDKEPIGSLSLVIRFMKGVARNRPSLPRYNSIWDVNTVLTMFMKQPLVEYLSLFDLTLRTATLLALVSGQRGQSIHFLDIACMSRMVDKFTFHLQGGFKQSRVGHESLIIVLPAYKADIRICIVNTLSAYLERTASLRHSTQLFISTVRPYKAVSKDTISRWIKVTLDLAGIDVRIFKPHGTRAAATSAAQRKGVKLMDILNVAGWTNETTFARFYNKPLQSLSETTFPEAVLGK